MASNAPPRRRAKRAYRGPAGGAGGLLPRLWHTPLWATLLVVTVMGCGLGYLYPNPSLPAPWGFVQSATGWTYTAAWSLSFYPQVLMHFFVKDVSGFSFDFLALNLLGWVCYTTFNVGIYFGFGCGAPAGGGGGAAGSAPAGAAGRRALLMGTAPPGAALLSGAGKLAQSPALAAPRHACSGAVELNDIAFAVHAFALTFVAMLQCMVYPHGGQTVHRIVRIAVAVAVAAAGAYAAAVALWGPGGAWDAGGGGGGGGACAWVVSQLSWVDWLYFLSFIKMGVTLVKYIPQALFNARRRSTKGWSISNIALDLFGSVLSMGQQIITCWRSGSWAGVTSNPVKLGLALISMAMDVIFMVQHYILYPEEEEAPVKYTYTVDPLSGALSVVFEECGGGGGAGSLLRGTRSAPARGLLTPSAGGAARSAARPRRRPAARSSGAGGVPAAALAVPRQLSVVAVEPALLGDGDDDDEDYDYADGGGRIASGGGARQPLRPQARAAEAAGALAGAPGGGAAAMAQRAAKKASLANPFKTAVAAANAALAPPAAGGLRAPLLSVNASEGGIPVPMLSVHSVTVIVEEVSVSDLESS